MSDITYLNILEQLQSENSTNKKIEILKENKDIPYLKQYLDLATNKLITFGIAQLPEYELDHACGTTDFELFEYLCNQLSTRAITGNAAREAIVNLLKYTNERTNLWWRRCLQKDLSSIGLGLRLLSKAFGEEKKFRCSGASPEDKIDKMIYPADGQYKINGFRTFWYVDSEGKVDSSYWDDRKLPIGRSGLAIENFDFLIPYIEELNFCNKVIDCEVECDDNLSEIQSLAGFDRTKTIGDFTGKNGKVKKGWKEYQDRLAEIEDIMSRTKVIVFEILDRDEFESQDIKHIYVDRRATLEEFFKDKQFDKVELVKSFTVNNKEEAIELADRLISEGKEGIVVKTHNGKYGFTKDSSQVKIKRKCDNVDCAIIGWEKAKETFNEKGIAFPDMLGRLMLQYKNNKGDVVESGCGTGKILTRAFKLDFAKNPDEYIGRIVECSCQEFSEDGIMICPRVDNLRNIEDKNTID